MTVSCDGQVDFKLHLSVGQVILFPYFDHCWEARPRVIDIEFDNAVPGYKLWVVGKTDKKNSCTPVM